jgi:hypothetical protein
VSGRTDVTNTSAVVIGPPLEGSRWVNAIGCCSPPSVHRTATLPINGKFHAFERFAIDFAQLNPENKLYSGPRDQLSSYAYVGAKVLAVADGTVINLQDGRPNETPPNFPQGYDLLQQLGNFLIIDIGHGHFAFYAHFQPNTLKVRKGDKVRRGQVLALVGNSGNSDAPHLHFGIEDGPLPFASNGVPFVFSSFTTTGTVTNPFDDIRRRDAKFCLIWTSLVDAFAAGPDTRRGVGRLPRAIVIASIVGEVRVRPMSLGELCPAKIWS